jgi:DNA polymerase-3 subunit alpha
MSQSPFIHLRVHSAYSLLEGAIKIPKLAQMCQNFSMPAVALTDRNNLFGAMEFAYAMKDAGVQPIFGITLDFETPIQRTNTHFVSVDSAQIRALSQIVILAQSPEGYQNLLKLASLAYDKVEKLVTPYITFKEIQENNLGLICLSGGVQGPIGYLLRENYKDQAIDILHQFKSIFQNRFYIELQRHELENEIKFEEDFVHFAYDFNVPLVATNEAYYPSPDLYKAHDALLCIARSKVVTDDESQSPSPEHYFKSSAQMVSLFSDLPEAIENTLYIAQRCHFLLKPRNPILPSFSVFTGSPDEVELRAQVIEGLQKRLKVLPYLDGSVDAEKPYWDRMEEELGVIIKTGFPGYFLIVADFIQWANQQQIAVGPGRGSGAGSLVAWALTITGLDPIRFGLLFERFLNPERVSLPDFDIDFCQERRDEVIAYVQQKYGADRVAQIITFGKLQARMVIRDVGRVLAMPYPQVDKISKLIPNNPANPVTLQEAIDGDPALQEMRDDDPKVAQLLAIGTQLEGLYRHASTHAAGVVIGDRPLVELVALYKDPNAKLPATQFNMKYVEQTGLVKFDFLGLKTLSVIQKAVQIMAKFGVSIDIDTLPLDDPKTYEMLQRGDTIGVFQIEGAGMRDVVKRIRPDRFEELIAIISLYRPGPMDNIPKYIACKHGEEKVTYLHPLLEGILKESYGIMIYQEQVMQAAQTLAGYTLGGADLLRRAMGKKVKAEMDAQCKIFVEGATAKGIDPKKAALIFEQMAKFAGYGFNKSHAAGYAMMLYQTAYLKANYPAAFFAASMSFDLTNTDKLRLFFEDAKHHDIKVLPPDVNESVVDFRIVPDEDQYAVRYGLGALKNVGPLMLGSLIQEREKNGPYQSLQDFFKRVDNRALNRGQLVNLILGGAFDALHPNRAQIFQALDYLINYAQQNHKSLKTGMRSLFGAIESPSSQLTLPKTSDWVDMEKISREFQAFGFYFSKHPLDTYGSLLDNQGLLTTQDLQEFPEGRLKLAGVIMSFKERLTSDGRKWAIVQLSDRFGVFEVSAFSEVLTMYRDLFDRNPPIPLIVTVNAKRDIMSEAPPPNAEGEEQPEQERMRLRLNALEFKSIDESIIAQRKSIVLILRDVEDLRAVKAVIDEAKPGNLAIRFYNIIGNQKITIDLSRRISLSVDQISKLTPYF